MMHPSDAWSKPALRHVRTASFVSTNAVRRYASSSSSWFLLGLAVVIAVASTVSGVSQLRHRSSIYSELTQQKEVDTDRLGRQLNGWQVERALRVLRAPEPLSAVVAGADADAPIFWDFGPAGVRRGQSLAWVAQAPPDFDFAVRVVLGLLAILLALESVAVERASGTLLAVLGQYVHPIAVLAGKFAGAAAALAFGTMMVVTAMVAALIASGGDLLTTQDIATAVVLGFPAWLYALSCFALAVLVTTLVRSFYMAVTAVLILWVVTGLNGTAIVNLVATTTSPASPSYVIEAKTERLASELTRQAQMDIGDQFVLGLAQPADWRKAQMGLSEENPVTRDLRRRWIAFFSALRSQLDAVVEEADHSARRQRTISTWLSFISPGALFTTASSAVAGTGVVNVTRREQAVQMFQRELNSALFDDRPRLILHVAETPAAIKETTDRSIVAFNVRSAVTVESLPGFRHPDTTLSRRLRDGLVPSLVLAFYVLGLVAVTGLVFEGTVP